MLEELQRRNYSEVTIESKNRSGSTRGTRAWSARLWFERNIGNTHGFRIQ